MCLLWMSLYHVLMGILVLQYVWCSDTQSPTRKKRRCRKVCEKEFQHLEVLCYSVDIYFLLYNKIVLYILNRLRHNLVKG